MTAKINIDTTQDREQTASQALENEEIVQQLVEWLQGSSRIKRQKAASTIALVAQSDATALIPYTAAIEQSLESPEAQTRWEVLHALDKMGKAGQTFDDDALAAAEDALYDKESGFVREAAFEFLCGYGGASPANSDKVWPLIDEAIQCNHGNPEFPDMLTQLGAFAQADISLETSAALAKRMKFDAENATGTLRMRAEQIVDANAKRQKAAK